ncbi:transcriptional regulator [Roseospira goensis]|uniref:Uncharacterized protein n=1 Tax=Roseospira goensis TaxID=391922 RepID=A0A7W6WLT3_9PROT|nr:transcriptional regulator [Roseospira goensis]MBB4287400.1 hypothetical protein [Roseospira goensis]
MSTPGRAIARARAAWGDALPAAVEALAAACDAESQGRVAARILRRDGRGAYSATVINQVLGRCYPGDLDAVLAAVAAALIPDTWDCPGLGQPITADSCWDWQAKARGPAAATSSHRMHMRRACQACARFHDTPSEEER